MKLGRGDRDLRADILAGGVVVRQIEPCGTLHLCARVLRMVVFLDALFRGRVLSIVIGNEQLGLISKGRDIIELLGLSECSMSLAALAHLRHAPASTIQQA
jgi:hypothetical protein